MTVEEILEQRGEIYGSFSAQLKCISAIVQNMEDCATANGRGISPELKAEWYFLAITLSRTAANPSYIGSYVELIGYIELMISERK
jgi:hypothetical protein